MKMSPNRVHPRSSTLFCVFALVFFTSITTFAQNFTTTQIGRGTLGSIKPLADPPASFFVVGGGQDIGGTIDQFTFHHLAARLDFDWRVQVAFLGPNDNDTKAGLMVREDTSSVGRMAYVRVTPFGVTANRLTGDGDVAFQFRSLAQSPASSCGQFVFLKDPFANQFIRLVKSGTVLGAYRSTDGIDWTLLCSEDSAKWAGGKFADTFLVGLAVSRGPEGTKETVDSQFQGLNSRGPFPPTISAIPDQELNQGSSSQPLPFTIGDADSGVSALKITTRSSNPSLIPDNAIAVTPAVVGAPPSAWTIAVSPLRDQLGESEIMVSVSDGTFTASTRFRIKVNPLESPIDYGDAPDPLYRTLISSKGASHRVLQGYSLGNSIDGEKDGQPNASATGDGSDEDGVVFNTAIVPGKALDLTVTLKLPATLKTGQIDGWMDWNGDGDWLDEGEHILHTAQATGPKLYTISVPVVARPGSTFARFRLSQDGFVESFGPSNEAGEVEDYLVSVQSPEQNLDFGDAPDPKYPTLLANNGARHVVNHDVFLGKLIDAEKDGQPDASAKGDDTTPAPDGDEDGVKFSGNFVVGQPVTVIVTASVSGRLSAWFDWGVDSSWAEPGDAVLANVAVASGPNSFVITVPANAKAGSTFARFRYSRQDVKEFVGLLPDGEVEDYLIRIGAQTNLDFGDAPDPKYPTLLANDGARHVVNQDVFLGKLIDAEKDGQPDASAKGDDTTPAPDGDEDGVKFSGNFVVGQPVTVIVTASVSGRLSAWFDWGVDSSWAEPGDAVLGNVAVATGANSFVITVPANANPGSTFARFRYSRQDVKEFVGLLPDGEVEDYLIRIGAQTNLDFGDAPDPKYPTLIANNGARHVVNQDVFLGKLIDGEVDGQPQASAKGDDATPPNGGDEDGVKFGGNLVAGQPVTVIVTASVSGRLSVWFDWNADSSWGDLGDLVLSNVPVSGGANSLVVNVPSTAKPGITFARFRFSRQDVKEFVGLLPDGEVEDYEIRIGAVSGLDFGDAPDSYRTKLAVDGPRHIANSGFTLGKSIDSEPDGQPSAGANLDGPDEDGVIMGGALNAGFNTPISVTVSSAGLLSAWFDFNSDGDFADAGERVFNNLASPGGASQLQVPVPATVQAGPSFARFRFSKAAVKDFFGAGEEGEVEDYPIRFAAARLDFGDAPEQLGSVALFLTKFPTTLARDGARHAAVEGFTLGRLIDVENNGQRSMASNGDDLNPSQLDDEDGIVFPDPLVPGEIAVVRVHAPKGGFLDAWIDFDGNTDWSEANNRIFNAVQLVTPVTILSFPVPVGAKLGNTYSRFRLSEKGGLDFKGFGGPGEVEDHLVEVRPDRGRCDLACTGKDFWLAFPGNYYPDPTNQVRPQLCLVGQKGTIVTITIDGIGYTKTVALVGNSLNVELPKAADLGDLSDAIVNKGIHVVSTEPIGVYGLSQVKYTSDGFLGLPTESLAREYIVASYPNVHTGVPELNGTQFAVVATEPLTTLSITPSFVTPPHDNGFAFTLVLTNVGDVYQLRNTNDAPADLTGTIIESDKPVAVFSGHQVANVNSSEVFFADYIVEQLPPVRRWGREFFPVYSEGRLKGDTFRVIASADNTEVEIDGTTVANLDRGEFYETVITTVSAHVKTSRRSLLMQYANSSDFDGVVKSDPFMTLVPARPHFSTQHVFCTAPAGFEKHYINVVVPVAAKNTVNLDGAAIGVPFFDIGTSGYAYGQKEVTAGVHTVTTGLASGVTVYGWSEYESYAWPACLFFGDTTPPKLINCPTHDIVVPASSQAGTVGGISGCTASVPNLLDGVSFKDNCNVWSNARVIQDPPPGTLVGVGTNCIFLRVTDAAGNVGECKVNFIVKDPNPDGELTLLCPQDFTAKCTSTNGAIVRYTVRALRGCTPINVECNPPSGSLFQPGITTVVCKINDPELPSLECTFKVTVDCKKPAPSININLATAQLNQRLIKLEWGDDNADAIILESAESPAGPWTAVPNARSGFTVDANQQVSPSKYFRLRER